MKRWTIKELNQISDLELARRILMRKQDEIQMGNPANRCHRL